MPAISWDGKKLFVGSLSICHRLTMIISTFSSFKPVFLKAYVTEHKKSYLEMEATSLFSIAQVLH